MSLQSLFSVRAQLSIYTTQWPFSLLRNILHSLHPPVYPSFCLLTACFVVYNLSLLWNLNFKFCMHIPCAIVWKSIFMAQVSSYNYFNFFAPKYWSAPSHYLNHVWSLSSSDIHLRKLTQEIPEPSFTNISLRITYPNLPSAKSTLVHVMAWYYQTNSHHLSQHWSRPMSPHGITGPQWGNELGFILSRFSFQNYWHSSMGRHESSPSRLRYLYMGFL